MIWASLGFWYLGVRVPSLEVFWQKTPDAVVIGLMS